jgi:siroheme synthase-like protein
VIGGGRVAERKAKILLRFDALVRLISPKVTQTLIRLAEKGKIEIIKRKYEEGDLKGAVLVFAATNKEEINRRIRKEAEKRHIPVNVVDNPDLCDFVVPSIVKKGPIVIAISTSGTLPLLSKKLRKEIQKNITGDYIQYAYLIGRFRELLIEKVKDRKKRSDIMKEIGKIDIKEFTVMDFQKIKDMFLREEP